MHDIEPPGKAPSHSAMIRELVAGLLIAAIGAGIALEALNYPLGTAMHMGPGFFPLALGVLLIGFGIAIMVFDTRTARKAAHAPGPLNIAWRPLVVLPLSILVFAFCIRRFGLAPATFASVLLSALAERTPPLARALLVSVIITALAVIIFQWGLELRVETFRW
ncbi:MAG TPA: tripartite tricarboxylate transporter TctB family protein [Paracoccus sp.]|nr:tripartite tricarboxylate transporter TctB family protein [Paracoccus sp. (in: a-proteobacteria)]